MTEENRREIQYQILAEAHVTANQLRESDMTETVIVTHSNSSHGSDSQSPVTSNPIVIQSVGSQSPANPIVIQSVGSLHSAGPLSQENHVQLAVHNVMGHHDPTGEPISQVEIPDGMVCLVCGDKGSGYHYSVFSCEGCKGFFKRSVQKNLQYTCKDEQNCPVNKYTRNSCQFCRFKKCLDMGMKKEAVREDRTPGGKHRHKRMRTDDGNDNSLDLSLVLPTESCDEVILSKLVDARPDLIPASEGQEDFDASQLDLNSLMQYGYMEVRLIIEWARKVPGFSELLIDDQMALLKSSFMELNILRLAYRSQGSSGCVKFAQRVVMSPEQCETIGWGKDLVSCTLDFCARLKEVLIDTTEFCILNAIVLTFPDAPGVQDKVAVINLQSSILDVLRRYSIGRYPSDPRRYGRMLLRIPVLRSVAAIAADRFLSMSLDGSIKMNALVLEMMM